ncbi:MAG TPA: citrate/2-methylcitrate synthase, partial [Spirochaetota bacterium]|nr:citrate/2-methylcitrate synthase [Spirochaetota bacterium]
MKRIEEWANKLIASKIDPDLYSRYNVKRGLRNSDGSGVLVGLTGVGDVHGYIVDEGEASPVEGRLRYRGIDVKDLTVGFQNEKRFGFEETAFLLMFGYLP